MEVMTEEQYLSINGAGRQLIGEPALHKNRGRNSDKQWRKLVLAQAKKDHELISVRSRLREEFHKKLLSGEIREPTSTESLIERANGMDELESVQAARRICEKRGIKWKND